MNQRIRVRRLIATLPLPGFVAPRQMMVAMLVLAFVAAACSSSSAGTNASVDPGAADVTLVSHNMAFDQDTVIVAAGSTWSLQLVNEDSAPHNVAIFTDESARESVFVGELIASTTIVYQIPALEAGMYHFRCDLHPEMMGVLKVEG